METAPNTGHVTRAPLFPARLSARVVWRVCVRAKDSDRERERDTERKNTRKLLVSLGVFTMAQAT